MSRGKDQVFDVLRRVLGYVAPEHERNPDVIAARRLVNDFYASREATKRDMFAREKVKRKPGDGKMKRMDHE